MRELIAKRYIKAIKEMSSEADFENISALFATLAESFENEKFLQVVNSPSVSNEQKKEILLGAVESAQSDAVNNLIALLAEKGRIDVIPAIADEMEKEIARLKKSFIGTVYSNSDMDPSAIEGLSSGLGKKVDASIALSFVKNDFDGVKVEVPDLNIEINFSKSRINTQLVEHILKAI